MATLVFAAVRMAPGDPVDSILGEQAQAADRDALRSCLRLDLPIWRQYLAYLGDILDGTMGRFCDDPSRTVAAELLHALPPTIQLALAALLTATAVAIPLGALAAVRPRSWVDLVALTGALIGAAVPTFWMGPLLLVAFGLTLGLLPDPGAPWSDPAALVLPTLTLAAGLTARLVRMTRASMLETLTRDHVRTARAKGLAEHTVVLRHALRNALMPVVTVLGMQLGGLLAGAIIVEKVFARPGLGTLLLSGIQSRDYALVQGTVLCIAFFYVAANWFTDTLYRFVDPRLATQEAR